MSTTIYVLIEESGDYESTVSVLKCAYLDEDQANKEAARLNALEQTKVLARLAIYQSWEAYQTANPRPPFPNRMTFPTYTKQERKTIPQKDRDEAQRQAREFNQQLDVQWKATMDQWFGGHYQAYENIMKAHGLDEQIVPQLAELPWWQAVQGTRERDTPVYSVDETNLI